MKVAVRNTSVMSRRRGKGGSTRSQIGPKSGQARRGVSVAGRDVARMAANMGVATDKPDRTIAEWVSSLGRGAEESRADRMAPAERQHLLSNVLDKLSRRDDGRALCQLLSSYLAEQTRVSARCASVLMG
jgi:hypothetical protein